jgi:hypothetical protein
MRVTLLTFTRDFISLHLHPHTHTLCKLVGFIVRMFACFFCVCGIGFHLRDLVEDGVVARTGWSLLIVLCLGVEELGKFRVRRKQRSAQPHSEALERVRDHVDLDLIALEVTPGVGNLGLLGSVTAFHALVDVGLCVCVCVCH